jgi:hypothetical protein
MQAMPDSRSQSFEEIYGPPENFLEIEVSRVAIFVFYTCLHTALTRYAIRKPTV